MDEGTSSKALNFEPSDLSSYQPHFIANGYLIVSRIYYLILATYSKNDDFQEELKKRTKKIRSHPSPFNNMYFLKR